MSKKHAIGSTTSDRKSISYLISCSSLVVLLAPLFISEPMSEGLIEGHIGSILGVPYPILLNQLKFTIQITVVYQKQMSTR